MKYRLKNREAQAALDKLTDGQFTKEFGKEIERACYLHGGLEDAMEDRGYVAFVDFKPSFARSITLRIRLKDIEEVAEKDMHPDAVAARRYMGEEA